MPLQLPIARRVIPQPPEGFVPPDPLPSILEQTDWPVGFYKFPDEGKGYNQEVEYFNCGLVEWRGRDWLLTRRRVELHGPPGHNHLMFWPLFNNEVMAKKGQPVRIPAVWHKENWEDARVINVNGRLLVNWCNFRWNSYAHQCVGWMNDRFAIPQVIHPHYGKNGPHLMANSGHEKNWTWFMHDGQLKLLYNLDPQIICDIKDFRVVHEHRTKGAGHLWTKWGHMRGGAPPVRVGDEYWTFFHSSSQWIPPRRRYHTAVYVFDAKPPFHGKWISRKPLLSGSEKDPRNEGAPVVVFPQGAILRNGEWLIAMGVNDCRCAWMRLPHADLVKTLRRV
jgi:predicted GH43/DUF377 family glycosyl hydrolase